MTQEQKDNRPVLLLIDKDGYLVSAGDPDSKSNTEIGQHVKSGGTCKTITITEYRLSNFVWAFEKEKSGRIV